MSFTFHCRQLSRTFYEAYKDTNSISLLYNRIQQLNYCSSFFVHMYILHGYISVYILLFLEIECHHTHQHIWVFSEIQAEQENSPILPNLPILGKFRKTSIAGRYNQVHNINFQLKVFCGTKRANLRQEGTLDERRNQVCSQSILRKRNRCFLGC